MKKHLIPAIFFSVWTLVFGILLFSEGKSLVGPIGTGISAIMFWISFFDDLRIKKKMDDATENDTF